MMKRTLFILVPVLLFCGYISEAQNLSREFNVVGKDDVDYHQVPFDPEAHAVVMFDIVKARFIVRGNNFVISYERKKRVKVLTEAGAEFAEATIPYLQDGFGRTEIVNDIEAIAHNFVEGTLQRSQVGQSEIYDEDWLNNWKVKKLAFTNVRKGSILDLRYVIESPFLTNLHDWEFQSFIPTLYSECVVHMVPFYEYVFLLQGANEFDYYNSSVGSGRYSVAGVEYKEAVTTFAMENVPAFRDESFITSRNDYILKIDFQLSRFNDIQYGSKQDVLTTWPKLIEEYHSHEQIGKYIDKAERLAPDLLQHIKLDPSSQFRKTREIVEYLKNNFQWDGQTRYFASSLPKQVVDAKSGNSAELNLLLVGLMRAAGINAHALLISTRNHGKVRYDYPFRTFFNNVIVLVREDEFTMLTDATSRQIPFNRIPEWCINEAGLVIDKSEVTWIILTPDFESQRNYTLVLDCNLQDDVLDVGGSFRFTEYEAAWRRAHYKDTSKVQEILQEQVLRPVGNIRISNMSELEKPFSFSFKAQTDLQHIGDKPTVYPFLGFGFKENPLKQPQRTYPVDFVYPKTSVYTSIISVPDGYSIDSKPMPASINDALIGFDLTDERLGDKLKITATVTFKQAVYQPADYQQLRQHFDRLVSKFNEPVIFTKS